MPKTELGPLAERATYKAFHMVSTRWADNDQYGHINNAKFYEFVDSAVNAHLMIANALDESIGLVVDSGCQYTSALKFPDVIEVGIKVDRIGTSSVSYG
ncbi:MAG: acyl-CoA thioesterase, partial [Alphaproteobacteria bacterium]|nr:acyl-CoA thioesterase [Alphaproteobacteria bacterium]